MKDKLTEEEARMVAGQIEKQSNRARHRTNAMAAMLNVTIRDGHDPEGAVAALVRAARVARDALSLVWLESDRGRVLDAALARFEVDDTEPAE